MSNREDAPIGRRELFRRGLGKAAEIAVDVAETRVEARARQWVRPPFALAELDFLIECSRCGDCMEVCPTGVIFPLSAKYGAAVAGTPAMDLANKACLMCHDWPCVTACEPLALRLPSPPAAAEPGEETGEETGEGAPEGENDAAEGFEIPPPRLAHATIDTSQCLPYLGPECGACNNSCPIPGALAWDGPKPRIDPDLCTGCGLCRVACITEPKSVLIRPYLREE